jgi:hypothetical protein
MTCLNKDDLKTEKLKLVISREVETSAWIVVVSIILGLAIIAISLWRI